MKPFGELLRALRSIPAKDQVEMRLSLPRRFLQGYRAVFKIPTLDDWYPVGKASAQKMEDDVTRVDLDPLESLIFLAFIVGITQAQAEQSRSPAWLILTSATMVFLVDYVVGYNIFRLGIFGSTILALILAVPVVWMMSRSPRRALEQGTRHD